jgi:hypothetical protein
VGKSHRKAAQQKRAARSSGVLKWVLIAAVLGSAVYGISQISGVAFDENDIKVVNFQGLTSGQKQKALEEANAARCTCGCGLGLAQCVSTDLTCPIRESNVERIKVMVRQAMASTSD